MIKLVAFDVDGTLRDKEFLPESTKQALKKLKEKGITLALCTGRSEFEMASLYKELEIDWAVTCNGCHIGHQGETIFGTSFSSDKIEEWLNEADKLNHAFLLYGAEKMFTNQVGNPYFKQAQQEIGFLEPIDLNSVKEIPAIYQCIVFCNEEEEKVYIGEGKERNDYYIHRWRTWAVDINPVGMNKAVGLLKLMNHLGIKPEEVAAIGDGGNDLEMLEMVGTGIAMGNANDDLKAKANYVTKDLKDDGIAYAVDKWILGDVQSVM